MTMSAREERARRFGIDCIDRLVWQRWEPGHEYASTITLKNTDSKTQVVEFRLPARRLVFLTPFPEPITLRSGMSHELQVRFCPTEVEELHDSLEIVVHDRGAFTVALDALTPYARLRLPEKHDFGFCAVAATASTEVTVKNTGTVPLQFYWEVPAPFDMVCDRVELQPGESLPVAIHFTPLEACAVVCKAVCRIAGLDEHIASITLSGIGKFPYVAIVAPDPLAHPAPPPFPCMERDPPTMTRINFGNLLIGQTSSFQFSLENPSPVDALVTVVRADDGLCCPFQLSPAEVTVPRGGTQQFRVVFRARQAGTLFVNRFELQVQSGNIARIEVRGEVHGPRVTLSASSIDFGDVDVEADGAALPPAKDRTRTLQLRNHSAAEAHYQVLSTSPGAAFAVEPALGAIPAGGSARVHVTFAPAGGVPMSYLRRLLILVEDAAEALYVDVFGTGYTSRDRPRPMRLADVEAHHLRIARGLGFATPEELQAIATSVQQDMAVDSDEELQLQQLWLSIEQDAAGGTQTNFLQKRATRLDFRQTPPTGRGIAARVPFALDVKSLLFSRAQPTGQLVTLHNPTSAAVTAVWCCPAGSPFRVSPAVESVPPAESRAFQVSLAAEPAAGCGAQDLECYVSYTDSLSFRTTTEHSFTAPYCLTLQCRHEPGRTLPAERVGAVVRTPATVYFPACGLQGSSYQVVGVENTSELPCLYEVRSVMLHGVSERVAEDVAVVTVDKDSRMSTMTAAEASRNLAKLRSMDSVFTCYPAAGVLPPMSRTLVVVQMFATSHARFEADASLMLNGNPADVVTMQLRGESTVPRLTLEDPLQLHDFRGIVFRPTCVTGETVRQFRLYNPTRADVGFRCLPSAELLSVVRVEPAEGVLRQGQRMALRAFFAPEVARRYEGTLSFVLHDAGEAPAAALPGPEGEPDAQASQEFVMTHRVEGEGMHGVVEVEPAAIDCGEVTGLRPQRVSLTVYNSGMCEVDYEVRVLVCSEPPAWRDRGQAPVLQNHTGTLPARSHVQVLATIAPPIGEAQYVLYCLVGGCGGDLSATAGAATEADAVQHPHCRLCIRGTQPALRVADVRALTVQRSLLWSQLSVNCLNEHLRADVVPADINDADYSFPQYIRGLSPVAMDLGVGPVGGVPMRATLLLENVGDRPVSFRFWLPTETDVTEERWFLEDAELHDMQRVIDRGVIEVSPAQASVAVGGTLAVTVTHRLEEVGVHTLPVLLKVSDGKRVLLVLEGRTLPLGVVGLALHHPAAYELLPVALGDVEPPMQAIPIDNPFETPVRYRVDTAALEALAAANHGFPVLQCVNLSGVLPPRSVAQLWWYFRPLEAREYRMAVTLETEDGEGYTLTFVGSGFHPRRTGVTEVRAGIERALLQLPSYPALGPGRSAVPVTLSTHVLRFGPLPYFSLERGTCLVTNHHSTDTYSFQWETLGGFGDHVVTVTPAAGVLAPGECTECRVVLFTGSTSQLLEWPATCYIVNETLSRAQQEAAAQRADTGDDLFPSADGSGRTPASASGPVGASGAAAAVRLPRKPVTEPALESLTLDRLQARLTAMQRRGEAATADGIDAVVWNSLELLLQARIMPTDDYERLCAADDAGAAAAVTRYQPAKGMYADPLGPAAAAVKGRVDEVGFVRSVMDELLRTLIAHPRVQAAFTEPCVRETVYYQDIVKTGAAGGGGAVVSSAPDATAAVKSITAAAGKGFSGNVLEEALEGVIYGLVREVMANDGVMEVSLAPD